MSRELAVRGISLLQITFPRNSVHFASGTTDSAYTLTTKPYAAKGRETLEPAAFDGELNQSDALSEAIFALSAISRRLKECLGLEYSSQTYPCSHHSKG